MSELSEATRRSVAGNIEQWTRVNREYGDFVAGIYEMVAERFNKGGLADTRHPGNTKAD